MKRGWIFIAGVVALFFAAVLLLGRWLDYDQMRDCPHSPNSGECGKADAIVAISGGDTTARANKAVQLYFAGYADKIVFSGAAADPKSPSNAKSMAKFAMKRGVAESDILLDERSKNTTENAQNVAKILRKNGWTNAILVSENYHLRRADTDFVRADAEATFRTASAKKQNFWWATPRGWYLIAEEIAGMTKSAADQEN